MIIEFAGIPGGGKTTLVQGYRTQYPNTAKLVTLDMYSKLPTALYSALFILRYPKTFFWVFVFVVVHAQKNLFLYSFHLALRACAKYAQASGLRTQIVFIDEGLLHLLCTLPDRLLSDQVMCTWVKRFSIKKSTPVIFSEGTFHRFHNNEAYKHPRVKHGAESLSAWEYAVRDNTTSVLNCLQEKQRNHLSFTQEDDKIKKLHIFLEQQF